MDRKGWIVAAGVAVAGVVGGAGAVTAATAEDTPLTGESRARAVAAAVAHVGGGEVTDTELGDDGASYEVEVRKLDGTQVEVNLDRSYAATSTEADDDAADEADDDADDVNDNDGPNDPDDDPGEPPSDPND